MFAVIRSGGKQHRVAENDRIVVERLVAEPGDLVVFDDVLMLAGGGEPAGRRLGAAGGARLRPRCWRRRAVRS